MKAESFVHCAPVLVGVALAPVLSYRKRLRGRIPMLAVDMNAHLIYRILINWSIGSHISIFIRTNVLINMELCKLFLTYFQ